MILVDLAGAVWRKSSRSGTNTNCVEVATVPGTIWRKSSRSGTNSNCVEVAAVPGTIWRKSSRSGSNTNCVEVATGVRVAAVRDSKDPDGPVLAFPQPAWTAFLADLRTGTLARS